MSELFMKNIDLNPIIFTVLLIKIEISRDYRVSEILARIMEEYVIAPETYYTFEVK